MKKTLAMVLALAGTGLPSAALATGFERGTADTDILYEPGTVSYRLGLTYVDPRRGFETINGVADRYGNYAGAYEIPSHALYFGNEFVGCAGTYTETFAAEADYRGLPGGGLPRQVSTTDSIVNTDRLAFGPDVGATSRTRTLDFEAEEFGVTCRVSYPSEMGRFSLLGGVFAQDFQFEGSSLGFSNLNPAIASLGPQAAGLVGGLAAGGRQVVLPSQIDVRSEGRYKAGYRIGAAYEMPEIALRAQILYRSEVEHDDIRGTGTVSILGNPFVADADGSANSTLSQQIGGLLTQAPPGAVPPPGFVFDVASALNPVTAPQSVSLTAQTGIAEGTLLLGSFRWTDWSSLDAVVIGIDSPALGPSSSYQPYFWDDGYSATLGIGRALTEEIAGLLQVGFDSGVSTGADTTYTDLYTLGGGFSFSGNEWSEMRLGGVVGLLTDGEQRISDGSYFDATVDDDFVYGLTGSIKLTF